MEMKRDKNGDLVGVAGKIKVELGVSNQFVEDLLCNAIEAGGAGIGYWAVVSEVKRDEEGGPIYTGCLIGEDPREGASGTVPSNQAVGVVAKSGLVQGRMTAEAVVRGLQMAMDPKILPSDYTRDCIMGDLREGDGCGMRMDASVCDVVVQLVLFGEVVYS